MTTEGIGQIVLYAAVLVALAYPLGRYMAWVYTRKRDDPVERGFFRLLGRRSAEEQSWKGYALTVLIFSVAGVGLLYAILRLQGHLPVNPDHMKAVSSPLALNTAASFLTNTNWQFYAGEATMSLLKPDGRGSRCRTSSRRWLAWRCWRPSYAAWQRARAATSATSGATSTVRSSTSCCRSRSSSP